MAVNFGGVVYDVGDRVNPDVVIIEQSQVVVLEDARGDQELVVVERTGPRGDPGDPGTPGAPGPQGPQGPPRTPHHHTQTIPSESWLVQHRFGFHPVAWRVIDADGNEVDPEVTNLSVDVALFTFSEPTAGTADVI